ncbi:chemotaxis protein CheA [Alkalimarinus sediminis]|uniref:Chemotaxis protein CheA n=1 Tax=Alkalimarinus sediminis TaxID=1632866 RepID=A0A9E8HNZ5_9ALTE|nr:chemotaxis protein CheA [Alkalimarinus sediminis]UZW76752.1 chemotaxis protein CheA [Alkalimarinus sediminis]
MSIDLSQFHQVFFEESYEGLDVMESALLNLQPDSVDPETINEIFRAAHSIKGGSGTFGFNDVASFTHVVETLLDEIRGGVRNITSETVDLFLRSVDCIRRMIQQHDAGEPCDIPEAQELKASFEAMLAGGSSAPAEETAEDDKSVSEESSTPARKGWKIYFKPELDVLRTGNDPLRMFRELESLGSLRVTADTSALPLISAIDPEACYLAWTLELDADVPQSDVDEVFEWVVDESDLKITPLALDGGSTEQGEPSTSGSTPTEEPSDDTTRLTEGLTAADSEQQSAENPNSQPAESATATEQTAELKPAEAKPAVAKPAAAASKTEKAKTEVSSIRVGIDKVDDLINMVGELVITQSMLGELGLDFTIESLPKLLEGIEQLSQNTRELQESVMRIRMLPISFTFSRFPRLVHDLSRTMGKKIELKLSGEQTELDKTVMEKIGDPLVHLVRNSLDHGIETPEDRIKAGKPETGTITLNAFHQSGNIVIQIIDDGAGLNKARILEKAKQNGLVSEGDMLTDDQINDLIFRPGFSTADQISDISGRGVGMDVVRRNINELNGSVEVESTEGEGSVFTIRLPLTLAILDGQLIRVGNHTYILPLISIVESIQSFQGMLHRVVGGCDLLRLRDEYVPIIQLASIFNIESDAKDMDDGLLVVVEGDNMKVAILIDDLEAQQQVVIKSLEENYKKVDGVSGATILGDGTVSLILDIAGLIKLAGVQRYEYKSVSGGDDYAA